MAATRARGSSRDFALAKGDLMPPRLLHVTGLQAPGIHRTWNLPERR
jgi:hypothetical protein